MLDSIATSTIYTCYVKPSFASVYSNTLRFIILPAYAFDSTISAIAAWYFAHIERNDNGTLKTGRVVYATVTTVAAIAMIGATIFGLLAQFKSTFLSPLFFVMNMALNAFYNLGASIYYWGKWAATPALDESKPLLESQEPPVDKKKLYRDRAIGHSIAAVLSICMSAVAIVVVPLAKTVLSPLGIVLGAIGFVLNVFHMVKSVQKINALRKLHKSRKAQMDITEAVPTIKNTAEITKQLPVTPQIVKSIDNSTNIRINDHPKIQRNSLWKTRPTQPSAKMTEGRTFSY